MQKKISWFALLLIYRKWLLIGIGTIAVLVTFAREYVSPAKPVTTTHTLTVTSHVSTNQLYYTGTIQPSHAIAVISPADGVVETMPFHYGDTVSAKQLLFTLHSEKFQTDYKTALVQYVKARSDLNNNQNQLYQGDFLHKNKLISDDEFKIRQTNFYNAQLAFLQAKDSLSKFLGQIGKDKINLYDLSIADVEKVNTALHLQAEQQALRVIAPAAGIVLLPVKNDVVTSDKKLGKGEEVKQGDVLALIGDENGISVRIAVNEFDIHQIQIGQRVKITGTAFAEHVLEGTIAGVDHQAQSNQNGMPTFAAEVKVPALTPAQQRAVFVGMSAKVEVSVEEPAQLTVPLAAVHEKMGVATVSVLNSTTHRFEDRAVKTGKTTADAIVIADNLQAGEQIAIPD